MELFESPFYKTYIKSFSQGDFESAKKSMLKCIENCEFAIDNVRRAVLYSKMADIYRLTSDLENAEIFYKKSIEIDSDSYLIKLDYADFVGAHLNNLKGAITICDDVIANLHLENDERFARDLSKGYYLLRAHAIRGYYRLLAGFQKASIDDLHEVWIRRNEQESVYSARLCEAFVSSGIEQDISRRYINFISK